MGKKLGNDYRVWVESATPGTYNRVLGQRNLRINRGVAKIDLSTKDDQGYAVGAYGLREAGLTFEVLPDLPDATGYTRLETLALASPAAPFNIQVRKGGNSGSGSDVVFQASVYGNLDNTDAPQNGGLAVSVALTIASAPSVDALA